MVLVGPMVLSTWFCSEYHQPGRSLTTIGIPEMIGKRKPQSGLEHSRNPSSIQSLSLLIISPVFKGNSMIPSSDPLRHFVQINSSFEINISSKGLTSRDDVCTALDKFADAAAMFYLITHPMGRLSIYHYCGAAGESLP